jgi:cyclase
MRLFATFSVLSLFAALATAPALAQRDFSDVAIETTDLGGGVYMLTGAGGNLGASIGKDGIFLIDDQFAPLTDKIKAALAGLGEGKVHFVINTHWHGDHTGGNENLAKDGTAVVAHDNVRLRMAAPGDRQSPQGALPIITYNDRSTFHINGEEIHAFHVHHAHTDGDSVIHFRGANVIHTGDLLFNGFYPFVDLNSGGSVTGLIAALERIHALADDNTKIIPGHGKLASKGDVAAAIAMLKESRAAIQALIDAGQTEEQIKAAEPLRTYDDKGYGSFFITSDRWIGTLIADLSGESGGL